MKTGHRRAKSRQSRSFKTLFVSVCALSSLPQPWVLPPCHIVFTITAGHALTRVFLKNIMLEALRAPERGLRWQGRPSLCHPSCSRQEAIEGHLIFYDGINLIFVHQLVIVAISLIVLKWGAYPKAGAAHAIPCIASVGFNGWMVSDLQRGVCLTYAAEESVGRKWREPRELSPSISPYAKTLPPPSL